MRYLNEALVFQDMGDLEAKVLNTYLGRFFISVKKRDRGEYKPSSLTNMLYSIDRNINMIKLLNLNIADLP